MAKRVVDTTSRQVITGRIRWAEVGTGGGNAPLALGGKRQPEITCRDSLSGVSEYARVRYVRTGIRELQAALAKASRFDAFYVFDPGCSEGTWWPVRLETDDEEERRLERERANRLQRRAENPCVAA